MDNIEILNSYGKKREAILFIIDYKKENFYIKSLKELDKGVEFEINKKRSKKFKKSYYLKKEAIPYKRYKKAFKRVKKAFKKGDSYLLNLTFPTKIETDLSLKEIYKYANAKFKLKFFDKFVCFSPERFIKIKNNRIATYPMKGTIETTIKNAKKKILNNKKEMAEHIMVVDLLRNDLAIVSKRVRVKKFRYTKKIKAGDKKLIQVSSKIVGELEKNWQNRLGEILTSLLPAGSITGTPKLSTTKIIERVEKYQRGYFTGIFGVFDGESLDSAVIIRFIEKREKGLFYKSGGGITIDSKIEKEYREMINKVYLPL